MPVTPLEIARAQVEIYAADVEKYAAKTKVIADRLNKIPRPMGDRGQGRKALPEDERMDNVTVRLTKDQQATFKKMGAGKWLRDLLDKLKGPQ